MSLRDTARADTTTILDADGDTIALTSPVVGVVPGTTYSVKAQAIRVSVDTDADGLPIVAEKSTVTVSIAALVTAGVINPEALRTGVWTATVDSIAYRVSEPLYDYALGRVTLMLKRAA